jgi:hypothetical protein
LEDGVFTALPLQSALSPHEARMSPIAGAVESVSISDVLSDVGDRLGPRGTASLALRFFLIAQIGNRPLVLLTDC